MPTYPNPPGGKLPPLNPLPKLTGVQDIQLNALSGRYEREYEAAMTATVRELQDFVSELRRVNKKVKSAELGQVIDSADFKDPGSLGPLRQQKALYGTFRGIDTQGVDPAAYQRFIQNVNIPPHIAATTQQAARQAGKLGPGVKDTLRNVDITHPGSIAGSVGNLIRANPPLSVALGLGGAFWGGVNLNRFGVPFNLPGYTEARGVGQQLGKGGFEAYKEGLGSSFRAFTQGLNPFDVVSVRDVTQVQSEIRRAGFRGPQARGLENAAIDIVNRTGLAVDDVVGALTTSIQTGVDTVDSFKAAMIGLKDIARDTGVSLEQAKNGFLAIKGALDPFAGVGQNTAQITSDLQRDLGSTFTHNGKAVFTDQALENLVGSLTGQNRDLFAAQAGLDYYEGRDPANITAVALGLRKYILLRNPTGDPRKYVQLSEELGIPVANLEHIANAEGQELTGDVETDLGRIRAKSVDDLANRIDFSEYVKSNSAPTRSPLDHTFTGDIIKGDFNPFNEGDESRRDKAKVRDDYKLKVQDDFESYISQSDEESIRLYNELQSAIEKGEKNADGKYQYLNETQLQEKVRALSESISRYRGPQGRSLADERSSSISVAADGSSATADFPLVRVMVEMVDGKPKVKNMSAEEKRRSAGAGETTYIGSEFPR